MATDSKSCLSKYADSKDMPEVHLCPKVALTRKIRKAKQNVVVYNTKII
jgi:hypothetical protein